MSQYLVSQATLKIKPQWTEQHGTATAVTDQVIINKIHAIDSTVQIDGADAFWKDQITADTSGIEIDLKALDHKSFGGSSILSFDFITTIYIENLSETETVNCFVSTTDQWDELSTGEITLKPGGSFYTFAKSGGWDVLTNKKKVMLTSTASANVDLLFIGKATS